MGGDSATGGLLSLRLRAVTDGRAFHDGVLVAIVVNAVVIGMETSPVLMARHGFWLSGAHLLLQGLFMLEIALRLAACWPRPGTFFRDPWNVFDFTVVALSLLPVAGPFTTVARVARLLRVTRVISAMPDLRLIVATMLCSIPSMGHVILLLGLLLYVYGVLGVNLFARVDPQHWGSLGAACLTLFQILTLEGWVEIQRAVLPAQPPAWLFFGSFIVIAVFVVINLFIAVVINNLERAKTAEEASRDAAHPRRDVLAGIATLQEQLARLEHQLREAP